MSVLQITINAQGVPNPNGNGQNPAKMSRTGANGEPNQVNWKAAKPCTVTFPAGFFQGFADTEMKLELSENGTSATQTLLTDATVGNTDYTITMDSASGPPNPPMIVIEG